MTTQPQTARETPVPFNDENEAWATYKTTILDGTVPEPWLPLLEDTFRDGYRAAAALHR